ncbi:MAG TPA: hypothetical protein PKJ26_00980 [Candidatus Woesebacteria bacterium]|nr:hypothetical protein [Candidatus Woesebacteria bacterium]
MLVTAPESEPKQRFSLYLQPETDSLDNLNSVMSALAQEFNTPEFVPHVTLIPERWATLSEIVAFAQEIAKLISKPIPVTLAEVGIGETYFKCVFFTVVETPELLLLAKRAREVFGVTFEEVPFRAHFSMLYDGSDSTTTTLTTEQKQKAAEQLRQAVQLPLTYETSGIAIHTSTPVVTEWQQVAFVPFGNED